MNSVSAINNRRERIWHLMLIGRDPQSIKKELDITNPTLYRDISYLQKQSKQFVYDMAKGTHVLMYKKAIDGTNLALKWACDKFLDPSIPEKQKLGYLRLIGEFNKSLMELTISGPSVMAIDNLRKKIENAGINISSNFDNFNPNENDNDKYDNMHNSTN